MSCKSFCLTIGVLKLKLQELRHDIVGLNEKIRDRDWRNKVLQKVYADAKRGAKKNDNVPGDQVLLKNTKVTGKLTPDFESEPYKVKAKEGHALTLHSKDGNKYRRNSSFVKPYQPVQESTKKLNLTYGHALRLDCRVLFVTDLSGR